MDSPATIFHYLTRPHPSFAARAWLFAPAVELSLKVAGLRRTLRAVERLAGGASTQPVTHDDAERLVGWAFRAHPLLTGRCLSRALLQYAMHRADGVAARLVVGVRRDEPESLAAHAWVEALDATAKSEHASILASEYRP